MTSDIVKRTDFEMGLPEGWRTVRLRDVTVQTEQLNPRREPSSEFDYVDVSGVSRDGLRILSTTRYRGAEAPSRARKKIRTGDVLFATVRPALRRIAMVPSRLDGQVCSTAFCVVRANPEYADPDYLFFSLASDDFVTRVSAQQHGSSYPAVTDRNVFAEEITLPDISEQRSIASVLRAIRQAMEATEKVVAAIQELKRSLMRHFFTYGPRPIAEAESVELQETAIGLMPNHWAVIDLGDVITQAQYGLSIRGERTGPVPMLRMNNLIGGRIDTKDLQYIDVDTATQAKFRLEPGDLLFNRTNSYDLVGKTALFEEQGDWVCASYLVRVRTDGTRAHSRYLNFYLNWEVSQARLRMLATRGVGQSNISATKLKTLQIALPPMDEQEAITDDLVALDQKIEKEIRQRQALETLFASTLAALMEGTRRVAPLEAAHA